MSLIKVKNVSKSFKQNKTRVDVIEDVSMEIKKGEIIALLGKSGCGKSTLLNIIGGFLPASKGEVIIDEKMINGPRRKCIMLFQHNNLLPWRSVYKNVALGLEKERINQTDKEERIKHAIALVGLEEHIDKFPHELSGGMQQRVAIARAFSMRPDVILMDEPFAALDTFNRYLLQDELLRIQAKEKTTILLVTHDIDEAVYLADRIFIMDANPGHMNKELLIEISKPRDRANSNFNYYRKRILQEFEFGGSQEAPEFTI